MKRSLSIAALLVAATCPLVAQAPATATGVVTVSFNAAVLQTAEAQAQIAALRTKYTPRQAQLKTLSDQIADMQKQLESAGDKLSEAERANREEALSYKEKQFQRDSDDLKSDSQSDSQQVFQTVGRKVYSFLQGYAKEHGYSVVIERGSDAAPVVWYVANNLDITDQLIKAYDAQSGAAKPAPAAAPKPAPSAPAPKK